MKTTVEIRDSTFDQARSLADSKGITVKQLFADAIEETVRRNTATSTRPAEPTWMKLAGAFGKTSAARTETRRIQKVIDDEFERIEPEDRQ